MATLQQSEALSYYGPCQIEIQPKRSENVYYVCVYDMNQPPRLVIRWQIDHLRGYGSNESVIKIQTGRLVKYVIFVHTLINSINIVDNYVNILPLDLNISYCMLKQVLMFYHLKTRHCVNSVHM